MRYIFSALLVGALALHAPSAAVAQTGFFGPCTTGPFSGAYVGAHTGWMNVDSDQVGRRSFSDAILADLEAQFGSAFVDDLLSQRQRSSSDSDAWMGGVHSGYNWQCGGLVFGGLTDISWTDAQSSVSSQGQTLREEYDYVGRVNGKLGVAFGNFMVYGTGGFAYARVKREFDAGLGATFSERDIDTGWNAGGGLEWAFGQWLLRAEAYYVDLDDRSYTYRYNPGVPGSGCGKTECGSKISWDDELVVARLGLSIKLHPEPPPAVVPFK